MIHLTEDVIVAVRDREPVADEVLDHLAECGACARALEDARSRAEAVERALAVLAAPSETGGRVDGGSGTDARVSPIGHGRRDVVRGTGATVVPIGHGRWDAVRGTARGTARRSVWTVRWLGRAAALALFCAGALSALPGPFNGWIPRVFSSEATPVAPTTPAPPPGGQVGGRMEVAGGPLVVRLENVAPGTVIDVRRVGGQAVGVLAAAGSEFSYASGEVRAAVVGGAVTVELPGGVVPATLVVNGATYLVVRAGGVEVSGPVTAPTAESLATFQVPG